MPRRFLLAATLILGALLAPAAAAQDHAPAAAPVTQDEAVQHATNVPERVDIITPHITDSHSLEYPCLQPGWACHL